LALRLLDARGSKPPARLGHPLGSVARPRCLLRLGCSSLCIRASFLQPSLVCFPTKPFGSRCSGIALRRACLSYRPGLPTVDARFAATRNAIAARIIADAVSGTPPGRSVVAVRLFQTRQHA
jgi:hypothetical protein